MEYIEMKSWTVWFGLLLAACSNPTPTPSVDLVLSSTAGGKTLNVLAGAAYGNSIYAVTWGGAQMIDHTDHGRELQIAWQLNDRGEGENPTEAGAAANINTQTYTKVLSASTHANILQTSVLPAYWLPFNNQLTSPHILNKTVTLDGGIASFEAEIKLIGDQRNMAVEGITAYMPREFNRFFFFDESGGKTEVPGTPFAMYSGSVMAATNDLSKAVGCYGVIAGAAAGFIGEWPKIDCSWFFVPDAKAGSYPWTVSVIFGTAEDVGASIKQKISQQKPMARLSPNLLACTPDICRLPTR